jgi:hypothetical protein
MSIRVFPVTNSGGPDVNEHECEDSLLQASQRQRRRVQVRFVYWIEKIKDFEEQPSVEDRLSPSEPFRVIERPED